MIFLHSGEYQKLWSRYIRLALKHNLLVSSIGEVPEKQTAKELSEEEVMEKIMADSLRIRELERLLGFSNIDTMPGAEEKNPCTRL